jgi:Ca-activated chloride channel family protein
MNGEVVNNNYLKVLSPNNIESINVLKGEKATALYGAKAANGVIVITTKDLSKRELRKIKRKARKLEKENPIITLPQPKIEVSKSIQNLQKIVLRALQQLLFQLFLLM